MNGRGYSKEEDAIIRDIWNGSASIKSQMHRLPGRTIESAKMRACLLRLKKRAWPPSSSWELVRRAVADGTPRTIDQVAQAIGVQRELLKSLVYRHMRAGDAHIVDWQRREPSGQMEYVFLPAPGPNKPRPKAQTQIAIQRRYMAKKDKLERKEISRLASARRRARLHRVGVRDPLTAALYGDAAR